MVLATAYGLKEFLCYFEVSEFLDFVMSVMVRLTCCTLDLGSDFLKQHNVFHKLMISILRIPSWVNRNKPLKTMNRIEISQLFSAILLFHISVIFLVAIHIKC